MAKRVRVRKQVVHIATRRTGLAMALVALFLSVLPGTTTASPGSAGRLAFASDRDGDWDIYIRQPDGTIGEPLVNTAASEYDPSWSPDGSQLVFSSKVDGDFEIYLVNADGSNLTKLTDNGVLDRDPEWSPDGTRIVFARSDNPTYGNEDLYVMQRDPILGWLDATLLAARPGSDRSPEYSPDGSLIAFTDYVEGSRGDSGKSDIYVRNSDGSGTPTRLTLDGQGSGPPTDDLLPTWSPDGSRIAFVSNRSERNRPAIWVMNRDGSNARKLTSGYDYYPDWSPDGKYVAFQRYTGSKLSWCVFMVEVANPSNVTNLVTGPAWDGMPDW
jgi:Tol biopolymer transport system component